ncbi:hypothetical protein RJ639_013058 [Escallonia herrerae]|uniref:Transposase (putative) gypsy type domain-containing protein n=1 Tax=Escallonia herrerae TaxID=1293975 RepID=A0AA88VJQ0_9ASTE|nr:hypothetical protein RJ639_013058 [Escallonia herrerae]
MGFCSGRILFYHSHSARVECYDEILIGQTSVRPLSLCSGRILFSHSHSAWIEFYSTVVILLRLSVRMGFYSDKILLGCCHCAPAKCSDGILLGQILFGHEPLLPLSSQPPHPSTSQPSPSLPAKNALGDVKDQAEDEANPKPWYTMDENSSKMSTEDLVELLREYPLPEGWYARLPGLQEPANYGTKYETGIYEEQVRSGYGLPLHPFALRFFEHYHMVPGQLVPNGWRKLVGLIYLVQTSGYKPDATDFMRVFFEICFVKGVANCQGGYFLVGRSDKGKLPFDRKWNPYCKDFENPCKPTPNNLTKHILSHIKLRGGLSIDEPLSEQQLKWARIIPRQPVPVGAVTPPPAPTISSTFPAESTPLVYTLVLIPNSLAEMASGSGFLGVLQKAKGKRKEKQPSAELPLHRRRQGLSFLTTLHRLLRKCLSKRIPSSLPDGLFAVMMWGCRIVRSQSSTLFTEFFLRTRRFSRTKLTRPLPMYASGFEMLSRFVLARQVAAEEAQQKREAIEEAEEATQEVKKARDQGISDFLDENVGDEWLKKRVDDGLEIYELGFTKAKEMFAERLPDIPLDDFVLPAVISLSGKTVLPSEARDAAASHPLRKGPSGNAPEP